MSDFTAAVRDFVSTSLTTESALDPTALTARFIKGHAKLVRQHTKDLVRKAVRDEIIRRTKERPEDHGQMALFPGLPAAIRVDENRYVPRDRATWADLLAGRQERVENIANAEKALALYDNDIERLRPYMADDLGVTVADAINEMDATSDPDDEAAESDEDQR